MKIHMKKLVPFLCLLCFQFAFTQENYFYPNSGPFNKAIPTPEQFLGYAVGEQHTRHEKIVAYLRELDRLSDRVATEIIGKTFEQREQIVATFTAPENHNNLNDIRLRHLEGQKQGATQDIPLIIHLGYNVHGNEPSSSEAAMLTAYYLTASESEETLNWLKKMVILMDPVINPDGRDRHTHWANMHKGTPPVADPIDREHTEIWPGGRGNHYWFDLNRDWFLGTFPETRNRIEFFHKWRPYVQTDHHEMGTNSTFYFDPGEEASNNPNVPDFLYKKIYPLYAEYFRKATDRIGSMYYTKESYDKLYPGYGSSYINFYGGAGFLFEQASSRGHVQETTTIPITFGFTIRNQFTASLTTIRASLAEKNSLLQMRKEFYIASKKQAEASPVKGYQFTDDNDYNRVRAFIDLLLLHRIEVFAMKTPGTYYVPVDQDNYIMVRSIFENQIAFRDSSFYDASSWSLIHAYGLPFTESKVPVTPGNKITSSLPDINKTPEKSNYAYLVHNTDYNTHRFIYELEKAGVIVQTATRPFTSLINGNPETFGFGSIVVSVQQQRMNEEMLYSAVKAAAEKTHINVQSVGTGFNVSGVDLGSNYIKTLKKPEVLMLIGTGVTAPEAGEIWHLFDQRLQMPVTKADILNFGRIDLNRYNTLILVSGSYSLLDKSGIDKIKSWVQNGNTLITLKSGAEWAIRNGFTKHKLLTDSSSESTRVDFDRAVEIEGAKALGGSIFRIDLDTTHPIGYGYTRRKIAVYKNGLTLFQKSGNPYNTVAQYTSDPVIGGYIHSSTLKKIKNSPSLLVGSEGGGRVILFADEPNFRGTWYGTNRLFLNAVFYGNLINVPAVMTGKVQLEE
jgi:hypothetical protein